jgi:hypothetical protein
MFILGRGTLDLVPGTFDLGRGAFILLRGTLDLGRGTFRERGCIYDLEISIWLSASATFVLSAGTLDLPG